MPLVTEKVLKKIKPSSTETKKFQKATAQFIKKLNFRLKGAKGILGGSGEKDTWLSGSGDIDIFVQFDYQKYKEKSDQLSALLELALKQFPKKQKLHGSRDYFQVNYQGYLFEVVPILKVTAAKEAFNITDISPLHAQWVNKNNKKLKDEIRLAKAFAQANNCYGAESYIGGFSGYVLEILVIYYQSFQKLLEAAVHWENKDVVDPAKHYLKNEVFRKLNLSKLNSPLIIIDPVDKNRNAAAALTIKKFLLFKQKAREFLQKPEAAFFEKEKISFKELEKKTRNNVLFLEIVSLAGKEDVVGTKLLKAFQFLQKKLEPYRITESNWNWNKKKLAFFYFILEKKQIEPFLVRLGPPLEMEKHAKEFKKKNKTVYIEKGRLMAKLPIKNYKIADFIKEAAKDTYFKDKIKSVKKIQFG